MKPELRILIVDDDRRMTGTLADILALQNYEVVEAFSGAEAIAKIKETEFDCVLTDVKMPGMNGVDLLQAIRMEKQDLPVVFMTAYAADGLIQQGIESGALGVLNKPLDINNLLSFLASLMEEKVITVVDDDPEFCQTLADILERRGFRVRKVTNPHTDVTRIIDDSQVILLDMKLNSISGYDILKQIRQRTPDLPVMLVTGYRKEMTGAVEQALEMRAFTCLYKPLVIPELLKELREVQTHRLKKFFPAD
jgi:two-component system response regulator HydG